MTGEELIALLRKEDTSLPVRLFAHDHNSKIHDEGLGEPSSVTEQTNDLGETLQA